MFKKLICSLSFVMLCLLMASISQAADPDLAAYWKFDEGSGNTAFDSSGNGNNGTFVGSPQWVAGKFGGALQFDGDDYVNCGNGPSLQIQDQITLAFWFNVQAFQNTWEAFMAKSDSAYRASRGGGTGNATHLGISGTSVGGGNGWFNGTVIVTGGEWHHYAGTYDGSAGRIYIDGVLDVTSQGTGRINLTASDLYIGENSGATGRFLHGVLDEVRIYRRALTDSEILGVMAGAGAEYPFASQPSPADGAVHADTWVTLSWRPGDFAVTHDVYLGESFEDVEAGTGDTFRGNQASTFYVAGFPGFAYPEGLVPGTTYYWRIDEVNDAEPNSPWKGPVWSFTIPPKKAYNPVPADGAKFIDPQGLTLSWTGGFGSKLHTVYFGDDFDTVSNAAGGLPQGTTSYTPKVPLAREKTYYWRVDEFDAVTTHKGDVWSFTIAKDGGGVRADYFKGMNFDTFVLTRIDPQIDFNWGDPGGPDPLVGNDQFSARWTGEVEPAFTETYTFYTNSDDGVRLWIDGRQLVDNWTDHGPTENSGTVDMVAGNTYSLEMEYYENGGGAVAELRWSSPSTPKQLIPQAALSPPVKASGPYPTNGATGERMQLVLTWNPGDFAASHDVYFGTDADAVVNAGKTSPEYKGSKALGNESYDPGKLAWDTAYYWRVDEVNDAHPDSPWKGNLWSFRTGDFLVVDNFESYTDDDAAGKAIWQSWIDGFGVPTNGSQVGYVMPPYAEQTIVHSGRQSMPMLYNNTAGVTNSEAELKLVSTRDWTEEGVSELSIWFHGQPGSTGGFVEAPAGTYTIRGSGADIWNTADEFHFAYKTLTGAGSIVARVVSVQNTNAWAKAGVMIRETLEPGSKHALGCVTPGNGVSSQGRDITDNACYYANQLGLAAPYWVKLERDLSGNFTAYHSANGTSWQPVTGAVPTNIQMGSAVYIGLAVTSHDAAQTCEAVFSNVTITGTVSPQWSHQDIGIASNSAEPLYVTVANSAGQPAVVVHDDPAAAQIDAWTEWRIPLSAFSGQGINLTNVDKIALGLGAKGGAASAGGSGTIYFDDIRLYRPAEVPQP